MGKGTKSTCFVFSLFYCWFLSSLSFFFFKNKKKSTSFLAGRTSPVKMRLPGRRRRTAYLLYVCVCVYTSVKFRIRDGPTPGRSLPATLRDVLERKVFILSLSHFFFFSFPFVPQLPYPPSQFFFLALNLTRFSKERGEREKSKRGKHKVLSFFNASRKPKL